MRIVKSPPASLRTLPLVLFAVFLCVLPFAARADDASSAQAIIRSQVEALGRDDGNAAYSYASPAIQQMFPQPDVFMSMVRQGYAPVYRHKSFEFGESKSADGKTAQRVRIVDANGELWDALYTVEQQADGTLKISGCVLLKVGTAV